MEAPPVLAEYSIFFYYARAFTVPADNCGMAENIYTCTKSCINRSTGLMQLADSHPNFAPRQYSVYYHILEALLAFFIRNKAKVRIVCAIALKKCVSIAAAKHGVTHSVTAMTEHASHFSGDRWCHCFAAPIPTLFQCHRCRRRALWNETGKQSLQWQLIWMATKRKCKGQVLK